MKLLEPISGGWIVRMSVVVFTFFFAGVACANPLPASENGIKIRVAHMESDGLGACDALSPSGRTEGHGPTIGARTGRDVSGVPSYEILSHGEEGFGCPSVKQRKGDGIIRMIRNQSLVSRSGLSGCFVLLEASGTEDISGARCPDPIDRASECCQVRD
ncbi:MAG: hypothetical protein HGA33_00065 [Candidatus Moranbacteria bacterium]|nr:hypothetical protein [Candidatus Moranbacteria bacterium]